MSPVRPGRPRAARAFTLIEMLLALAITAMLLVAVLTFVFSMGEIWGRGRERRLFEQHVDAVTHHVETLVRRAALPLGDVAAPEAFALREVRTEFAGTRTLLSFDLPEGDRLLEWPESPLPDVRCALAAERGAGLVVYWQSILEEDRANRPPRRTVVTPLVSELIYLYRDSATGRWDTRVEPQRTNGGRWLVPDALRLTFRYGTATLQRTIALPLGNGVVPVF